MKKKKLTLLDILGGTVGSSATLSRTEMKQIMAGSGYNCIHCVHGKYCVPFNGQNPGPGCAWITCDCL